jgi:hypothetical protein
LSQKLEKKRPGIVGERTIQKIYLNQFRAELDAIDPYFFVDAFPGIVHKKFKSNLGSRS